MTVELSTAVSVGASVGAMIFAAGGAWITLKKTEKTAISQGKRIGAIEKQLAMMQGIEMGRTAAKGIPVALPDDEPSE